MPELTPAPPARAPAVSRGLQCSACGRTTDCTTSQLIRFSRKGFPWCCGEVMAIRSDPGTGRVPEIVTEKRLGQRRPALHGAQVELRRGALGLGPSLAVALVDVSDDGLCVHLKEPVAPGEEVEVALGRPLGGKLHKRRGRVRWCRAGWWSTSSSLT